MSRESLCACVRVCINTSWGAVFGCNYLPTGIEVFVRYFILEFVVLRGEVGSYTGAGKWVYL